MGSLGSQKREVGYMDWSPRKETRHWLACTQSVLQQYRQYWPLTIRQIFYRLVANYDYPKSEQAYGRLINYLGRARRAQMIPFEAIRDDGMRVRGPHEFESAAAMIKFFRKEADHFQLFRQSYQPERVEIFCEAAGMVPLMANAVAHQGVDVYSGGGFNSLTTVRNTAQRIANDERRSIIIQFGDYDPSGESIFDSFRQDVEEFAWQICREERVTFIREALTGEQVDEMGIPTAPPKLTDARSKNWIGDTAQLEAISPDDLAQMARDAVARYIDDDIMEDIKERELVVSTECMEAVDEMRDKLAEDHPTNVDFGFQEEEE